MNLCLHVVYPTSVQHKNLGELTKMRIGHNSSGVGPGGCIALLPKSQQLGVFRVKGNGHQNAASAKIRAKASPTFCIIIMRALPAPCFSC